MTEVYSQTSTVSIISIWAFINVLIVLGLGIVGVYALILLIKFLRRGIKALDIYIDMHSNKRY